MIICIGNALVDSLEQIEEFVVDELNLNKARMTLVDKERSNFLLQNMKNPVYEAGGSAANTAYWISQLGGKVGFIGKISNDNQTGLCAIFITPDGERTMNTYLGAGEYLSVEDLNIDAIKKAKILYMEGYLWDKPSSKSAFLNAAKINKESGGLNSISLSDVFCVEMHRDSFTSFIADDIDYVFCNEDELNSLSEKNTTEESIKFFSAKFPNVRQLICTLGPNGVLISEGGKKHSFDASEAVVVDKTGAGDFFAGGYLYGLQTGLSIESSAEIANKSAAYAISEIGVRPKKPFTI